jgi:vesicle-fusing ATPase
LGEHLFLSEEKTKMVRVVATPSQELALTNCAYCSRSDLDSYGSMVDVNNTIVLNLRLHEAVAQGCITLNVLCVGC